MTTRSPPRKPRNNTSQRILLSAFLVVVAAFLVRRALLRDPEPGDPENSPPSADIRPPLFASSSEQLSDQPLPATEAPQLRLLRGSLGLEICGVLRRPSDRGALDGFVTWSVAEPGGAHSVQGVKVLADGTWKMRVAPHTRIAVAVTSGNAKPFSRILDPARPCDEQLYEWNLESFPDGLSVRGRVEDVYGGPIAGANVDVVEFGTIDRPGFEMPVFRVQSDHEGVFALHVIPGEYRITAQMQGYAASSMSADVRTRTKELGALRLAPAPQITGKVVYADGSGPASGAEIRLIRGDSAALGISNVSPTHTLSDGGGRFFIDDIGLGTWAVYAHAHDATTVSPTIVTLDSYTDPQDILVQVVPAHRVDGYVRDADDAHAIRGASILLQGDPGGHYPCSLTDPTGYFDCNGLPDGDYTAVASAAGYPGNLQAGRIAVRGGDARVDVSLQPGFMVRGQVVPPVAGATIRTRMSALEVAASGATGTSLMNTFRTARTDSEGQFTIGPLSLGTVTLIAESFQSGRGTVRTDRATQEQGKSIKIVLERASGIRAQIDTDAASETAALVLRLHRASEPMTIDGGAPRGATGVVYEVPVGANGIAEAIGIEPGEYSVELIFAVGTLAHQGPQTIVLTDGEVAEFRVSARGHSRLLRGSVLAEDGDQPVENALIEVMTARGVVKALSEADGSFEIPVLSVGGDVQTTFGHPQTGSRRFPAMLRDGNNVLRLPSTRSLDITVDGGSGPRRVVVASKDSRVQRALPPSGSITIGSLLRVRYDVTVCAEDGGGHAVVDLERDDAAKVRIQVRGWGRVKGQVVSRQKEPLGGVRVLVNPTEDTCGVGLRQAQQALRGDAMLTSVGGDFEVEGLPEGHARLFLTSSVDGSLREMAVDVTILGDEISDIGSFEFVPGGDP